MRGVVFADRGRVEVRTLPEPTLQAPTDALVKVLWSAVCGTDLHVLQSGVGMLPGTVLGHEFVGDILEVGAHVTTLRPGDRVLGSDFTACGRCWHCRRQEHWECPQRHFFGTGTAFGPELAGTQAELVRVPHAETVLGRLPEDCPAEAAIFACDTLATGLSAAERGEVAAGDVVAIVGGGAVGQMTSLACQVLGAAAVVVVDPIEERRRLATCGGAIATGPETARQLLEDLTEGRGADVVVEAVGGPRPLESALGLVRKRGTVVSVGVHSEPEFCLPAARAFSDELSLKFVVGDPIAVRDRLLPLLTVGLIDPSPIVSERVPLEDAPGAYERFSRRQAVKILLQVGTGA